MEFGSKAGQIALLHKQIHELGQELEIETLTKEERTTKRDQLFKALELQQALEVQCGSNSSSNSSRSSTNNCSFANSDGGNAKRNAASSVPKHGAKFKAKSISSKSDSCFSINF